MTPALVSFVRNRQIVRVGNPIGKAQAQKTHEGQAVVDQQLGSFIGEIVRRLDHQGAFFTALIGGSRAPSRFPEPPASEPP